MKKKSTTKKTNPKPFFIRVVSHNLFFWGVVLFFVINALWIALSAVFPMMFDEELHFGVIQIYSHQLSPFITSQSPETVFHGDLTRSASYLFHYLMSFPFRFIALFTQDITTQVIFLRIINVFFVVVGLWLFRKLLLLGGFSNALTNLSIFFFTLIPLVPFTAAHINYDNLIMIFTPALFYAALKTVQKSKHQITWLLGLIIIGCLGSIVKFTFLPVFVAVILFLAVALWRQYGKQLPKKLWSQYKALSKPLVIILTLMTLLSSGLFLERYGGNIVQYRTHEPKCDRIHSKELCSQYNVWNRNTKWAERYQQNPTPLWNPVEYTFYRWVPHIFNDLFRAGAYTGGAIEIRQPLGTLEFTTGNIVLRITGWAVFIGALIASIFTWRRLQNKQIRYLFLSSIALYAAALWVKNYSDYTTYGIPVATQGRYFIPFLIPLIAMGGYALSNAIQKQYIKGIILGILLLLFTQGAGATTYILYSNNNWYWPNNSVIQTNNNAQNFLKLFIRN